MLATGEMVVVCTVCFLTYPTVLVNGFQSFHGHVSDVASSEENLACKEMKTIITNTPCIRQHLHSQIHQHSLQGLKGNLNFWECPFMLYYHFIRCWKTTSMKLAQTKTVAHKTIPRNEHK